jgi:hypothetical protein
MERHFPGCQARLLPVTQACMLLLRMHAALHRAGSLRVLGGVLGVGREAGEPCAQCRSPEARCCWSLRWMWRSALRRLPTHLARCMLPCTRSRSACGSCRAFRSPSLQPSLSAALREALPASRPCRIPCFTAPPTPPQPRRMPPPPRRTPRGRGASPQRRSWCAYATLPCAPERILYILQSATTAPPTSVLSRPGCLSHPRLDNAALKLGLGLHAALELGLCLWRCSGAVTLLHISTPQVH